jgi:hypothetical protein
VVVEMPIQAAAACLKEVVEAAAMKLHGHPEVFLVPERQMDEARIALLAIRHELVDLLQHMKSDIPGSGTEEARGVREVQEEHIDGHFVVSLFGCGYWVGKDSACSSPFLLLLLLARPRWMPSSCPYAEAEENPYTLALGMASLGCLDRKESMTPVRPVASEKSVLALGAYGPWPGAEA